MGCAAAHDLRQIVARNLKRLRQERGLSQEELADLAAQSQLHRHDRATGERWPPSVGRPGGGIKLGPVAVKPPVAARLQRPRRPRLALARRAPNAGAVSNKI